MYYTHSGNMKLRIVSKSESQALQSQINLFLCQVFNSNIEMDLSDELMFVVVVIDVGEIIACGFAYGREMSQGDYQFNAAILGGDEVKKVYQGRGICKQLLSEIEN